MLTTMRLIAATLVLSSGCYTSNFEWTKIKESEAPSHFVWRSSSEVWGDGASVVRRKDGTWEALDVCGPYLKSLTYSGNRQSITVGFASDGSVFALCGADLLDGQDLVHFDAAGNGVPMTLPNDGAVRLVQLDGDIALVGASRVFKRETTGFSELTTHPFAGSPIAAGLSLQEIYATGSVVDGPSTARWWNGNVWAEITIPDTANPGEPASQPGAPEHRAGTVGLGPWRVQGGVPTPFVTDNPGVERPVRFMSALPPDAAMYFGTPERAADEATNVVHLWVGRTGEDDLEYLGSGNFNSGSMYTAGGFGGYAVDDSSVLMLSTQGAIGGYSKTELWEGEL